MAKISAPVGRSEKNLPSDVKTIQVLLNRNRPLNGAYQTPLKVDGKYGPMTEAALLGYQQRISHSTPADAQVKVNGPTLRTLGAHANSLKTPPGAETKRAELTEEDFVEAARLLGCEVAAIRAVAQTESMRAAFDKQGRPAMLFERHKFSEHTGHRYDKDHPGLSNKTPSYKDKSYGKYSAQPGRVEQASLLDKDAALKSTSWGAFQILGSNYEAAGFHSVEQFVEAMETSEKEHLKAFVSFIKSKPDAETALKDKDWKNFALEYNGKGDKKKAESYATTMQENYDKISGKNDHPAKGKGPAEDAGKGPVPVPLPK